MENALQQVDRILRAAFPGATTELEMIGDKVHGFLLWDGFDAEDQLDRQRQLWHALRAKLGSPMRSIVSAIFTLTPSELALIREEASTD